MVDSWEIVYSTAQPYRAEILKDLLLESEIPAVIVNKQDSSYLSFGDVEVLVQREDILRAKLVVTKFQADE